MNQEDDYCIIPDIIKDSSEELRIESKASILRKFLCGKTFNSHYCFLVDMHIRSGKNRFFVFDLYKNSVMISGLVAHGSRRMDYCPEALFSNQQGSCCSSVGKYRIGGHYQGTYGKAYKLYGLDGTNSHAYARNIVLHAHACMPEIETDPTVICNSNGCPMVSESFLKKLEPILDNAARPIIMWIFN